MAHIFNLGDIDDNFSEKINLDDLYEKKRQHDLSKLNLFNKLLNRAHNKIKLTSRQQLNDQHCWFHVPEVMIGVPNYDQSDCIAYIMDKLTANGFRVKYIHPNVIFICWNHWIPGYIRNEIKKKTGMQIDGTGNIIDKNKNSDDTNPNTLILKTDNTSEKLAIENSKSNKNYKPINDYKPVGNMVYNNDMMNRLNKKL